MGSRTPHLTLEEMGRQIAATFTPDDLDAAKRTLRECLTATRIVRAGRSANGVVYEEVPDHPIRAMAATKIIEWTIGKPVSRSIVADVTPDKGSGGETTKDELLQMLLAAPDAAVDIVAKLQQAAKKAQAAAPVEIDVTPPSEKRLGQGS